MLIQQVIPLLQVKLLLQVDLEYMYEIISEKSETQMFILQVNLPLQVILPLQVYLPLQVNLWREPLYQPTYNYKRQTSLMTHMFISTC